MSLRLIFCAFGLLSTIPAATAGSIIAGLENLPAGGAEGSGDYNDMLFRMDGNLQIFHPGAIFRDLNASIVTGHGATFWDSPSLDALNANVGYCVLGNGNCDVSPRPTGGLQYLAGANSPLDMPSEVVFSSLGPVTFTMIGEHAASANWTTLGWYSPDIPDALHTIFAGLDTTGASFTFNPNGRFVLFSTNRLGQIYSSIAAHNQGESSAFQHFAFFQVTPENPPTPNPEPSTLFLAGAGILALGLRSRTRRRAQLIYR